MIRFPFHFHRALRTVLIDHTFVRSVYQLDQIGSGSSFLQSWAVEAGGLGNSPGPHVIQIAHQK